MHEKDMALEDVRKRRATTQQEIVSMEKSLMQAAQRRRKLYNTIQELKGNIRVFCRVRPVLRKRGYFDPPTFYLLWIVIIGSDKSQQHTRIRYSSDDITDTLELEDDISSMLGKRTTKKYSFTFDRVSTVVFFER